MERYESVIILKPDVEEIEIEKIIKVVETLFDGGTGEGNFEKSEDLGIKKLAYEIQGYKEGRYIIFYFKTKFETISTLETYYKKEDKIMKFIVLKMED